MLSGSRCIDWDNKKFLPGTPSPASLIMSFITTAAKSWQCRFYLLTLCGSCFVLFFWFFFSLRQSENSHIHSETAGLLCPHFSCGTINWMQLKLAGHKWMTWCYTWCYLNLESMLQCKNWCLHLRFFGYNVAMQRGFSHQTQALQADAKRGWGSFFLNEFWACFIINRSA